jgi:predicted ATPase/DNA-binding SARP family transcriptional activator
MVRAVLFGVPVVEFGEGCHEPPPGKATALLLYLAYHGHWVHRDMLLHLLWPTDSQRKARRNLSRLLTGIKTHAYAEALEVEPTRLRWAIETDVGMFRQALADKHWSEALRHYRGEFLHGFEVAQLPGFVDWLELERHALQEAWLRAGLALSSQLLSGGRHADAAELLAALHAREPLDEEVLQRYIRSLVLDARGGEALGVFEAFRERLQREMGSEPSSVTAELVAPLRAGAAVGATVNMGTAPTPSLPNPPRPLPVASTPFIGRGREKALIAAMLCDPACRVITVVGLGGVGKTRLVLQAARENADAFHHGVAFVSLASANSSEAIAYRLADALRFTLYGAQSAEDQVADFLRDKALLIVLDNLEQHSEGVLIVAKLIARTADVKFLVASRQRLNLHVEWVVELGGLGYPAELHEAPEQGEAAAANDALELFLQAAHKVRPGAAFGAADMSAAKRICRLVAGMPLAIELAAGRLHDVPVSALVGEVERSLDSLQAAAPGPPTEHQSIRAVFNSSWALLSGEERAVLRKLAVFRGGFRREAAEVVAGASLLVLAQLVNKCLLNMTPLGRYVRHPLLYRFTQEKLGEHPEQVLSSTQSHLRYYLSLAEESAPKLAGAAPELSLARLDEENDNLLAALRWALKHDPYSALRLAGALWRYWWLRHHLQEGRAWLSEVLGVASPGATASRASALEGAALLAWAQGDYASSYALADESLVIRRALEDEVGAAASLVILGQTVRSLGDYVRARAFTQESLDIRQRLGDIQGIGESLNQLGNVALREGDAARARALYQEGLGFRREGGSRWDVAASLNNLGTVALRQGDTMAAQRYHEESLALKRSLGDSRGLAASLNNLGLVALHDGDYALAQARFQEALELRRSLGVQGGTAQSLNTLGNLALLQGDTEMASRLHAEALTLWRRLGEKRGVAFSLQNLGVTAAYSKAYRVARGHYLASLALRRELGDSWGMAHTLVGLAHLAAHGGGAEQGVLVLAAASALLASAHSTLEPLERRLHDDAQLMLRRALGDAAFDSGWLDGQRLTLDEIIAYVGKG